MEALKYKPKRRSLLFFPSIKVRFYERALTSEADSIIFDLEDSIADSFKDAARETLASLFPISYRGPKELIIRINHPTTPFYEDDLALVKQLKPCTVMCPKVEYSEEVKHLEAALSSRNFPQKSQIEIIVLIETIAGFYKAREILASTRRITAVGLGVEDIVSETGIERGKLCENPILNYMLAEIALVSHMYEMQCLGPASRGYGREDHLGDLEEECSYLKKMNFCGKAAIHPAQIPVINRIFDITPECIEKARKCMSMFGCVETREGTAVITQRDEMEDMPSLRRALRLLKYAEEHGYV